MLNKFILQWLLIPIILVFNTTTFANKLVSYEPISPAISIQFLAQNYKKTLNIPVISSMGIIFRDLNNLWFLGLRSSFKEVSMSDSDFMYIQDKNQRIEFNQLSYNAIVGGFITPVFDLNTSTSIWLELEASLAVFENKETKSGFFGIGIMPGIRLEKQLSYNWYINNSILLNYIHLTNAIYNNERRTLDTGINGFETAVKFELGYGF